MTKLSVVIPVFNEEKTLAQCVENLRRIQKPGLEIEIIIVDDGSTDSSAQIAGKFASYSNIKVISHKRNQGKGAALHSGFRLVTGDIVAVQDADLEYDPQDFLRMVMPIITLRADVVIGSRFMKGNNNQIGYLRSYIANRVLTFCSNMFTGLKLTDVEVCYKLFKREFIQDMELKEKRFGFDPEIIAKIGRIRSNGRALRVCEMSVSYSARSYQEGKKICYKDGFRALYVILKYGIF